MLLGWTGRAAAGAKLAYPERPVVALTGDGSFLLGVPASAFWVQGVALAIRTTIKCGGRCPRARLARPVAFPMI
jgi:TPP-dependent 2-oxoacid decarboxylase